MPMQPRAPGALLIVLAALLPAAALAAGNDWAGHLRADARHFHATVAEGHPGPVDPENPGFQARLDAALATALEKADRTRDVGGYWWALREFQASFDDGHVQLASTDALPSLPTRWPGFLTRYDGLRHVVAARDDGDDALPPRGAVLVGCDGEAADALAERLVGRYRGRWMLESQRRSHGWRLFLDAGNPWEPLPRRCSFEVEGGAREFALAWRDMEPGAFAARAAEVQPAVEASIGLREARDGIAWVSLGSFDGDPSGASHPQLTNVVAMLRARGEALRGRPVVLDLRGNGGGSSHWSVQIAEALWGEAAVARARVSSEAVDWRVSEGNMAVVRDFRASLLASAGDAADPALLGWADTILAGLQAAHERGQVLWRQTGADEDAEAEAEIEGTIAGAVPAAAPPRVVVVTDSSCASACLDAMDLWMALGVLHVGRETAADTVYMEIRGEALPSGLARIGIPMKAYRGRARGSNEPYRPGLAYEGNIADTAELEAWIAERILAVGR